MQSFSEPAILRFLHLDLCPAAFPAAAKRATQSRRDGTRGAICCYLRGDGAPQATGAPFRQRETERHKKNFAGPKGKNDESGTTARWHEGCSENRRETAKRDRKRRTPKGGRRLAHHTPLLKIPVWWRRAVLPSLPWVVCFLSFPSSHPFGGVFLPSFFGALGVWWCCWGGRRSPRPASPNDAAADSFSS